MVCRMFWRVRQMKTIHQSGGTLPIRHPAFQKRVRLIPCILAAQLSRGSHCMIVRF